MGRDTLLFALLVMLFGGFVLVEETMAFPRDTGYWMMVLGLGIGLVGFWQAAREAVRE